MKSDPEEAEVDEVKPHSKAVPPPELVSRLVDAFNNGAKLSCGSKDPNSLVEWTHFLNECKAEYIDVSGRDLNCLPACLCIYLNFEKPGKDVAAKMRERLADWCANFVEFPPHVFEFENAADDGEGTQESAIHRIRCRGFIGHWVLNAFAGVANARVWLIQNDQVPTCFIPPSVKRGDTSAAKFEMVLLLTYPSGKGGSEKGHFQLCVARASHQEWVQRYSAGNRFVAENKQNIVSHPRRAGKKQRTQ